MAEVFNRKGLLDRVDGDRELLVDLFGDFVADKDEHLEVARTGVKEGNLDAIYDGAHALRGCVANFCAAGAFELATQLQQHASEGRLDAAAKLLPQLESAIDQLTEALRSFVSEK